MDINKIQLGHTYQINNVSKNNGRKCIVLETVDNNKAKIKFVDNRRIGKVSLYNLEEVPKVMTREEKVTQMQHKKLEINMLIAEEYEKIKLIEKRIEEYRIELLRCENELTKL
ncbi:hypothetical protein HFE03_07505 [Paenibacillus sp. EKM102P]|uniref:hypothetical protein n=1 Tax=unclassified Paenibacillus TaxID=185978 RepID=UPI00142DBCA0|nr:MULTISPECIES: hypothetical protein [unclassified Paenibacillus]KAF6620492.1 hypothetical protein HFE00_05410 [Paenibacillus sp. EKM101P]KAF6623484.1 hypothetical protein HFE03_07505 [Paenibacillus sp. EKM102P]KAF6633953.1 hypothetical protein HFE01_07000 [Paenibacillus sp. EKM10P]KAF6649480.1 hypothetical protein HFE02_01965 [Paenibacillus sp. EKM11P]